MDPRNRNPNFNNETKMDVEVKEQDNSSDSDDDLPILLPLSSLQIARQLSLTYIDPFSGQETSDDPDGFQGRERTLRENELLERYPRTGYSEGIFRRRRFAERTEEEKLAMDPIREEENRGSGSEMDTSDEEYSISRLNRR